MVIDLEVRWFVDLEALEHGITVRSFRVWTRAQFKTVRGWTPVVPALIDTGAPFCVLPKTLGDDLAIEGGFATRLRGLVPLPAAVLNARFGQVTCIVSDGTRRSSALRFWALLADGEVPLVLGCAGFLDRVKFTLDAPHDRAWLEL